MLNARLHILAFFFVISAVTSYAQNDRLFFEKVAPGQVSPHTPVFGITKDHQGFMWFGTWDGLYRYDGISFNVYRNDPQDSTTIPSNRIRNIFCDSNGTLWISCFNNTYANYNPEKDDFRRFGKTQIGPAIVDSLARSSNAANENAHIGQNRWYLADQKLWHTNLKTGKDFAYEADLNRPGVLTDDYVTWYYLSDDQILWVGTRSGDLNKADLRRKPFYFSYNQQRENGNIKNTSIRAICAYDNYLWLGTNYNGISLVDHRTGKKLLFKTRNPNAGKLRQVRTIVPDQNGNIWIGTTAGLYRYNPKTNKLIDCNLKAITPELDSHSVFSIACGKQGAVWGGQYNGLLKYDPATNHFKAFSLSGLIHDHSVMKLLIDKHQNIWLGTEGDGVICLKKGLKEDNWSDTIVYRSEDSRPNSLPGNLVYSLFEDSDGLIWVGTSKGLCSIDPVSGKVDRPGTTSNLRGAYISCILGDGQGNIWIAHKKGLARLDKRTGHLRNFMSFQGLHNPVFLDNAGFRDPPTGKLYFGAKNGYLSFDPTKIHDNPIPPKVVFTNLQILNKPVKINQKVNGNVVLQQALSVTNSITLSFWDRSFALEFAALHYSEPASNQYAYKLGGFDDDWIYTGASRAIASYSNLPSGVYTLIVKAANPDGVWSKQDAELQIKITPPFWATYQAYIAYFIFGLFILAFVYYYLISRIKLKNQLALERLEMEKKLEVDNMKLEFYTNVSHELRTPLSLIIDPLENLEKGSFPSETEKNYHAIMLKNARRLLQLINQLLDFRKVETQHEPINLTNADWSEFTKTVIDSFSVRAQQRNIQLHFQSRPGSIVCALDADKFEKILVNLISNAMKYTPVGGTIEIAIQMEEPETATDPTSKKLSLIVSDTGIGISPEDLPWIFDSFYKGEQQAVFKGQSTGIGLAFIKKLVELLGGTINVESTPGKGSKFRVGLPVTSKNGIIDGVPAKEEQQQTSAETSANNDTSSKPLLLIVDDNEDIRHYLKDKLQNEYTVVTAINGEGGIKKATDSVPDLIICDVMMPVMNGFEFCEKIKTDVRTSHIPVVLLTAHQSQGYQIEGLETGADAFVTKPFNSSVLKAQLKSLLVNRQLLRKRYQNHLSTDPDLSVENKIDNEFLQRAGRFVIDHLTSEGFNSTTLAGLLYMSQRQLYRKMNALTGQTVHQFITSIRLNTAKELLLNENLNISEVAYRVGYTEPSNFSRSFSKQFGESPTQYINSKK